VQSGIKILNKEGGLLEHSIEVAETLLQLRAALAPEISEESCVIAGLLQYIPLSDEEAQAIAYHDGMYVPEGRSVTHKEEPLLLLLHWGDMWTASVRER
jgi:hypothetical protein